MPSRSLVLIASIVLTAPALAAEPYIGKWAADAASCKSEPLFTFSAKNVVGLTFACESALYEKDGAGWKVAAKKCSDEESSKPSDMRFRLALDGGKLQISWDDGSKSDRLMKCAR